MKMSNTFIKYNNNKNKNDLFEQRRILNKDVENATKSSKLMKGIGIWTSWYRFFPQRGSGRWPAASHKPGSVRFPFEAQG